METLKTFDYSIFKTITSNREVNNAHVRRLVKAIRKKNLLHLNPIICNDQYQVIDGQHRLEAVREIGGIYIYYILDSQVSKEDIAAINSNSKNWSVMDYINYWTVEKKAGFDVLSRFISENPLIPTSTALMLCSTSGSRDPEGLRQGRVHIGNIKSAYRVAEVLKQFRNKFEHAYDRSFVMAVVDVLYSVPGYDHDLMLAKIELQPRSLVRCINKKQYLEMLEEIYNYKSSKSKLKFL